MLEQIKKKAKKLGISTDIKYSSRKNKRFQITTPDNKIIHFADPNATTFIDGADEKKRKSYLARASKITNKEGKYTYKIPYTANYLSYHLLWM